MHCYVTVPMSCHQGNLTHVTLYYTEKQNLSLINTGIYYLKSSLKLAHLMKHNAIYDLALMLKQQ
jgi:hypothetical protein